MVRTGPAPPTSPWLPFRHCRRASCMLPMLVARCCRVLVVLHTIHIVGIFKRHIAARRAPMHRPSSPTAGRGRPRPAPETAHHAPRGPTAGVQGIPNDTTSGPVRRTRVAKNALRATYAAQRRPPRSGVSLVEGAVGAEAVSDCVCLLVEYGSIGAWRPRLWDPSWTLQ